MTTNQINEQIDRSCRGGEGCGPRYPSEPRSVRQPKTGDVVHLTAKASVQFAGPRSLIFRIIRVDPRETYVGWVWLIGYSIDWDGKAIDRREVFVQLAGLIYARAPGGSGSSDESDCHL